MSTPSLTSEFPLRVLFDKMAEVAPELRDAQINALGLPEETRTRLCMMLAFDELIGLTPEHREARLNTSDLFDAERDRLRTMLAADSNVPIVLRATAAEAVDRLSDDDDELLGQPLIGTCVGTFRLLSLIGQGGSSTVFRAEREAGDGMQIVALKLLRTGLYTAEAQRRFRREQAILAQLTHPHIAGLIEGGVSSSGIPYIAIELVEGVPITEAADAQKANLAQRLRWFSILCRTIEAAHASLIVHRDLKPSNVLISHSGELKVLDFGIARLIDTDDYTTRTLSIALTPEYAAPEQFGSAPLTIAVDVYALGVILGELLTGKRLPGKQRASTTISAGNDSAAPLPSGLGPRNVLVRQLRGDLDAILATALAEEPTRRYRSAGAFADDVERYLAGQPVRAHPPSRWYRARKFVSRHRRSTAATALLLSGILGISGLAVWQREAAREQARLARSEARRANAARDFMVGLFEAASADLPRDERPTPEQMLLEAAKSARDDKTMDAALRVQVLFMLGKVALSAGNYAQAESLLDEAIQGARTQGRSISSSELIEMLVQKGNLLHSTNRTDEADRLMASVLPELLADDSEISGSGLMLYAATRTYGGHLSDAISIAQLVARKNERVFGPDSYNFLSAQSFLGVLQLTGHHYRESAQVLEQTIAHWRAVHEPENEVFARTLFYLAAAKARLGERGVAEALFREGIALMRRIYEEPHVRLANGLNGLAKVLISQERFSEAKAALDEALAINLRQLGADNVGTATVLCSVAFLHNAQGQHAEAERLLRQAIGVYVAHGQQSGYEEELAMARLALAEILIELNQPDEAADLQAAAASALRKLFGQDSEEFAQATGIHGRIALARSDPDNALSDSNDALEILLHLQVPSPRVEILVHSLRAQAFDDMGRATEALACANTAVHLHETSFQEAKVKHAELVEARTRLERKANKPESARSNIAE